MPGRPASSYLSTVRRILFRLGLLTGGLLGVMWIAGWLVVFQPVFGSNPTSELRVDPEALKRHVRMISEELSPRGYVNAPNLERCVDYIASEFEKRGARVEIQEYEVGGRRYRNVIGTFGTGDADRWIVGAHYDAFGDLPGADDNASGVAGLIELAGLLGAEEGPPNVELVAYALEEPPFFRSRFMGSAIHAWQLKEQQANVRGVVILEMIGYFDDAWMSQSYPVALMRAWYPSRGNFIALAGRLDQRAFVRDFKVAMKGRSDLPVYSINAPAVVPGIDFSDHLNYWRHGYNALMVTDTAFYRNREYHTAGDTWERLDYRRMADVVVMIAGALHASR